MQQLIGRRAVVMMERPGLGSPAGSHAWRYWRDAAPRSTIVVILAVGGDSARQLGRACIDSPRVPHLAEFRQVRCWGVCRERARTWFGTTAPASRGAAGIKSSDRNREDNRMTSVEDPMERASGFAIVGYAARFPGAADADQVHPVEFSRRPRQVAGAGFGDADQKQGQPT